MQAIEQSAGQSIDHTPASALAAGAVAVLGETLVCIARLAIAANELGAVWKTGRYLTVKDNSNMTAGCAVYWNADGDPYGGTAGSGAFSALAIGPFAGWCRAAASTTTGTFELLLESEAPRSTSQTVVAAAAEGVTNQILPWVDTVYVDAVTVDANDFVVLPLLATVPNGKRICVVGMAEANFEVRTPAASAQEINSEDCDGTKEYLFTNTQIHYFVKIDNTIGWMGQGFSAIGAVVTAVVPD